MAIKPRTKVPRNNTDEKLARLHAWQNFAMDVPKLTEEEAEEYLELEKKHFKRRYVLLRVHGRLAALRSRREKAELIAECQG